MATPTEIAEKWVWSWFDTIAGIQGYSLEIAFDNLLPKVSVEVFVDSNAADFRIPPVPDPLAAFLEIKEPRRISPYYHPVSAIQPVAGAAPGIRPGSSVHARLTFFGTDRSTGYGTTTAFSRSSQGNSWLITANHVTARNGRLGEIGTGDDGVYLDGTGRVSRRQHFVEILPPSQQNLVDAAAALLEVAPPPGDFYNPPLATGAPWDDPPNGSSVVVYCGGAVKTGTIVNNRHFADIPQPFTPTKPRYKDLFQMRINPPVVEGNSGSLVAAFDSGGNLHPIGILTAKSDTDGLAIACRLKPALEQLSTVTGEAFSRILTKWPSP